MRKYQPTIGLEIHLQLATKSKMFCSCENPKFNALPNSNICPICLGHPGTLPTINKKAVEMALFLGLALNGQIQKNSYFERKNYFYPDLPKGYQISQKRAPLVKNAFLEIAGEKIRIREIHLEEDTAKLYHFPDKTLIDFNRAGVPLLEIVTEPDIHSARVAKEFCRELQRIARTLKISQADMEKGEMRCEVNISISNDDKNNLGTKVEVKNLNSFRAVERAIEYEIKRQKEILERGGKIIQETRGWDEINEITVEQRIKEEVEDYRYFPEPDLPSLEISDQLIKRLKNQLPELPSARRKRFIEEYGFSPIYAKILTEKEEHAQFVEEVMSLLREKLKEVVEEPEILEIEKKKIAKKVGDWMTRLFGLETTLGGNFLKKIKANDFADFIYLLAMERKTISNKIAQDLLKKMYESGKSLEILLSEEKLEEISDEEEIKNVVGLVLENYPEAVADYKKGKKTAIKYLIGQVMVATKGKANPKVVEKLLIKFLERN
ncbi:MAG: Asp-tRNA(Asn)/Glu-tRNA(Gln) amidotransferase subunit GatB [Patescibacteria group bacterium]